MATIPYELLVNLIQQRKPESEVQAGGLTNLINSYLAARKVEQERAKGVSDKNTEQMKLMGTLGYAPNIAGRVPTGTELQNYLTEKERPGLLGTIFGGKQEDVPKPEIEYGMKPTALNAVQGYNPENMTPIGEPLVAPKGTQFRAVKTSQEDVMQDIFYKQNGKITDINGNTLTQVPKNKYVIDLDKETKEDSKQKNKVNMFTTAARLKEYLDKVPSAEGFMGRGVGGVEELKAAIGTNPNLKLYNDESKVILGQIAIAIGGESGARLSDQDIVRMRKAMPSAWETTTERNMKWDYFLKEVDRLAVEKGAKPIFGTTTESLPSGIKEEDIQDTMRIHSMTREEVLKQLGVK